MSFVRFIRSFSSAPSLRSAHASNPRKTLLDIASRYNQNQAISMVTAHDFITGRMLEKANIDIALVGDSLAMTTLGYKDTNELPFEEFLYHVRSVARGNATSFLVADLPFGTFERLTDQAVDTCVRLVKEGGVQGIKVEGGNPEILPTIRKLNSMGIPIMGHVGLTPQRHNSLGGFKLQGNSVETAAQIYREVRALQEAGVFAIVLECIPNRLAEFITANIQVPTIGIGAGPGVSGQVLVIADMLGMCDPDDSHMAKFVKGYDGFFKRGVEGLKTYKSDLEEKKFPTEEHGYKIKKGIMDELRKLNL
ncbi:ketopantoate hydroxymethyltransferase [Suhomyces tanzawaensis NRRL Y-17324]|uniref:3-methyl-2-oxobutanoate hydroxymethyltransferase n=1 Tax=Suhomyces tanzawaensis NRRL Y-17324 TaxID=984487 RepID=A0A1E4SLK9_9ASCO|nr:ketopantoate hydroxymethyltransferase [Suhomyces tanzawaensis NRRL Y-17324]ODV80404.1 ketopantoate hydroxymethyltransferase [Suhomyces tanzawaensis NRRL Y-17324]